MEIKPLSAASGAEVLGVDASTQIATKDMDVMKDALCNYGVLLLRNQKLTQTQLVDFTKQFGESQSYDVLGHKFLLPGYPDILSLSNVMEDGKPIGVKDAGMYWHTDGSYLQDPAWISMLYALEVPQADDGQPLGETLFANMAAAYDALAQEDKDRAAKLSALHEYVYRGSPREEGQVPPSAVRPVVLGHPRTGRKLVYVNKGFTKQILDLPEDEAKAYFDKLCEFSTQPQFRYVHRWQVGDVVLWDNFTVQHCAVSNYGERRRRLWRTTVKGWPWRNGGFATT